MLRLPGSSELGLGCSKIFSGLLSNPQNATNDSTHSATSVVTQDPDGNEVGSLSSPVLRELIVPMQLIPRFLPSLPASF